MIWYFFLLLLLLLLFACVNTANWHSFVELIKYLSSLKIIYVWTDLVLHCHIDLSNWPIRRTNDDNLNWRPYARRKKSIPLHHHWDTTISDICVRFICPPISFPLCIHLPMLSLLSYVAWTIRSTHGHILKCIYLNAHEYVGKQCLTRQVLVCRYLFSSLSFCSGYFCDYQSFERRARREKRPLTVLLRKAVILLENDVWWWCQKIGSDRKIQRIDRQTWW